MFSHFYYYYYYIPIIFSNIVLIQTQDETEIQYYTDLVENGINDALNYELPISAEEYRPNDATIKGNHFQTIKYIYRYVYKLVK